MPKMSKHATIFSSMHVCVRVAYPLLQQHADLTVIMTVLRNEIADPDVCIELHVSMWVGSHQQDLPKACGIEATSFWTDLATMTGSTFTDTLFRLQETEGYKRKREALSQQSQEGVFLSHA